MSKIAFLYPGQGAQVAGMGKDFYEQSELAKEVYEKSAELLDMDIMALCFEENERLNRTDYTQVALVTTCLAMTKELMARGIKPDMTAGLSLGEYCAIVAAGGMGFEDAVHTIWQRGRLMHTAVPDGSGGMAAVLGMEGEAVRAVTDSFENVSVANYNCPGQVVITGKKDAIEAVTPALKEAGAKRVLPLNVSGPFHSPFLEEAGEKLVNALEKVEWTPLTVPYVTNVTGKKVTDICQAKELLKAQVSSSVLWEQSIRLMIDEGVDIFVEIGPGKTLSGFMRKIDRKVTMLKIGSMEELQAVVDRIKELTAC
ncbi:MAG: ACP S-malonyltransferase [Eubacteriales bacterium]|nr:ACP S-malonyltransferase [Eubacteriales bacterium]